MSEDGIRTRERKVRAEARTLGTRQGVEERFGYAHVVEGHRKEPAESGTRHSALVVEVRGSVFGVEDVLDDVSLRA